MPQLSKKSFWITLKEYSLVTVGILLYVLGWTIFMMPNNLVGGGVSGMAAIIQYATKGAVKTGTTYFLVNAVLLIAGFKVLGKGFGGKTVWATIVASIGLNVFQDIIPFELCQILGVENGKLLSVIVTGIMVGVGIGITMSQGGSTGGTDIIALIVNKYRNISPGRMLLMLDAIIIGSSFFVPSYLPDGTPLPWAEKFTNVVYGFILIAINTTVLDMYLTGTRQSVQLFIHSKKYEEIADCISNELNRGVTVLDGKGWYSKAEAHVLMVVTKKADQNLFLRSIKSIDPDAFVSICSVHGVYGRGFDEFKGKKS